MSVTAHTSWPTLLLILCVSCRNACWLREAGKTHATASGQPVPLFDVDGQLAFDAPAGGSYVVQLVYPRRLWLWPIAALGLAGGVFGAGLIRARQQA